LLRMSDARQLLAATVFRLRGSTLRKRDGMAGMLDQILDLEGHNTLSNRTSPGPTNASENGQKSTVNHTAQCCLRRGHATRHFGKIVLTM
jgi:hypothetical protein